MRKFSFLFFLSAFGASLILVDANATEIGKPSSAIKSAVSIVTHQNDLMGSLNAPMACTSCLPARKLARTDGGTETSGGGDAYDERGLDAYHIQVAVEYSGDELNRYLNKMYRITNGGETSKKFAKIFKDRKIFEIMSNAVVEVRMSEPCVDSQGNFKDGSSDPATNSICISAHRLSQKLRPGKRFSLQVGALVLHELSHLCGTTEKEAQELQEVTLFNLLNNYWPAEGAAKFNFNIVIK